MDRFYGPPETRAFADAMFDHALHHGERLTPQETQIAQSAGRAVDALRVSVGCAFRGLDERNVRVVDDPVFFERLGLIAFARGPIAYVPRGDLRVYARNVAHEYCHVGSFQTRQSSSPLPSVVDGAGSPRTLVLDRRVGVRLSGLQRRNEAVSFDMLNEALTECAAILVRRAMIRDIGDPTFSRRFASAYTPYRRVLEAIIGINGTDDPDYAAKAAPALRDYFAGTSDWLRILAARDRRAMRIWRNARTDDLRSAVILATLYGFPVTIFLY